MAKLREGNLDQTVKAIVDTIMSESYLDRKSLAAKLRPVIGSLVKDADRPKNYDNIKTDKGKLVRTIEQKDLERDFWKHALRKKIGKEEMQSFYTLLDLKLIKKGFKDA